MENELKPSRQPADSESITSQPGPVATILFAVGFVGFVITAAGVVVPSLPALVVGVVVMVGVLSCFILCRKTVR